MKQVLVILLTGLLVGCAGQLYTVKNPQFDSGKPIKGIIVYQPKLVVVDSETTVREDLQKNVIGSSAEGTCKPVPLSETATVTDYTTQYAVYYDPAWLETHNIALTLSEGVLTSVNYSATTPAKEVADVLSGVATVIKEGAAAAAGIKVMSVGVELKPETKILPECNAGKRIIKIRDCPCNP